MHFRTSRLYSIVFAAALLPRVSLGWDAAGHMLVDQIAWENMKPEARARAAELVLPLEKTYNEGQTYNFTTAGCWMDDMRSKKGYAWSKWHYVNIAWTADGVAFEPPPPPHVIWAIGEATKNLKSPNSTPEKKAEALAMVTHFVGDIHQPMHATERGDRGGNGVLIHGVPFSDLWPGTVANLHAFWDKAFRFDQREGKTVEVWQCPQIADRPKAPGEGVIAEQAAKIMEKFPASAMADEIAKMSAVEWARESHKLGSLSGYPPDFQPTDDHHVVTLPPDFVAKARVIAERRVALAGYRLARLLNEALAP